ncbi:MAG: DUF1992 domain-containing protein [Acidimicrobiales bacterium]
MTERKPAWMSFESWVDAQIREATERGEFDNLPGKGRPLAAIDGPPDENWWVKQWLARENLSYTPPTLALRKQREDLPDVLAGLGDERRVREVIDELNDRIRAVNRTPTDGPPSTLMVVDVETAVTAWKTRRDEAAPA